MCPWHYSSNWANWLAAASSSTASTCWPSGSPAPARLTPGAPSATAWWNRAIPSSLPQPTAWCRTCWPPNATWPCPAQLRKLDTFDLLLIDDLGYLPQGAEESEVLFTLIAERYERRSLGITSNLVFSQWEHIFVNPMAPAAAIDRVVRHSVILDLTCPATAPVWLNSVTSKRR